MIPPPSIPTHRVNPTHTMIRRSQTLRPSSNRNSLVPRPTGSPVSTSNHRSAAPDKPLPGRPSSLRLSDFAVLDEVTNDSLLDSPDLKKRLRDAETEISRLRDENRALSKRPTQDKFDELDQEYKALELILDGTQRYAPPSVFSNSALTTS